MSRVLPLRPPRCPLLAFVVGACVLCSAAARGDVVLSEFLASNLRSLTDEDNNHEDWIEIYNNGTNAVSLDGWYLTDNADNLTKWRFPATNVAPGQFLVVFASNKNRRTPGLPLHTDFKLDPAGEYLALVKPDGVTVASAFAPAYPAQATDVSYGFAPDSVMPVLGSGAPVFWKVWTNATDYANQSAGWNSSLGYSTAGWSNATSGLGWDDTASPRNFALLCGANSNPRSLINGTSRTLFARFQTPITNLGSLKELRLRMKFDDGFAVWLNGSLVASNLPGTNLAWNALAAGTRDDYLNDAWASFTIPSGLAVQGTNLLAFQVFNASTSSSDLLLLPELDAVYPATSTNAGYLVSPTPATTNAPVSDAVPPVVELLSTAARPAGGPGSPPLAVSALVTPTLWPVTNVTLYYRVMFSNEIGVPMSPATGQVWVATVPTADLKPGEMLRWRIEARDARNNSGTGPRFANANDDDHYHGTVALNPAETNSRLPIVHWFVENYAAAVTEAGSRCSLFHLDRFYDNIVFNLHGQTTSTASFPKKSTDVDFNSNNRFRWRAGFSEAKDVKLLSNWADKSKVRNTMACEIFNRAGVSMHWAFPVRVQTNGGFHAILDMMEDGDDRFLERAGLDPNGALYKIYRSSYDDSAGYAKTGTNIWDYEKKSRRWESDADLAAFSAGVATNWTFAQRRSYVYDNVNLPATINYLAALVITSCADQGHKNFYLYRDSDGTREWQPLPWDVDLTLGHDWVSQYFNDEIRTNQVLQLGVLNRLKEVVFQSAELNQAFLRRVRTLMDTVLQPGGSPAPQRTNENRILDLLDQMDPPDVATSDADLDWQKWGSWVQGGGASTNPTNMVRPQAQRILDTFFPGRRLFLQTANPLSGSAPIPPSQPAQVALTVEVGDFNPAGGRQDQEYLRLRNTNSFAVDVSGWRLGGAVDYTFLPGLVIPSGGGAVGNIGLLYVAASPYAFRQRAAGAGSNQFCLVTGPYSGQLSARGETILLYNGAGALVASNSYSGAPSLAQQFLRITELMYNPAPLAGSPLDPQEFEFLELRNVSTNAALDLNGVRFANGVDFAFTNATVLSPGQRLVLARNPAAFTARYGTGATVAGPFAGLLENAGERLTLLDASNEEILDFSFDKSWHPITDGLGFSLVVVDELAEPDAWGRPSNWRASGSLSGAPGAPDPPGTVGAVLINEVLAHTDLPERDSIELFNPGPTNIDIGGWFLTDDFYAPRKYRIPNGTVLGAGAWMVFNDLQFNASPNPFLLSEYGEEAFLFSGDAATNLTGYVHGFTFAESPNGASFGRYVNSRTNTMFVLQSAKSLGAANGLPRVGPVVVSEIMYHPPDLPNGVDNDLDEFIKLQNITGSNVALYCVFTNEPGYGAAARTNTWKLRDAVEFDFPPDLVVAPNSCLLIVGFSPSNAVQLAAFRARYAVPTNIPVLGPWSGKLDNSTETIELKYPDRPDVTVSNLVVPYVMVEKIRYNDDEAWPAGADGLGHSLRRITAWAFGNDPANWFAGAPNAGLPDGNNAPPQITGHPASTTIRLGSPVAFTLTATGTAPLSFQWRKDGVVLAGQTDSVHSIPAAALADSGNYSAVASNIAGVATSSVANLVVYDLASVILRATAGPEGDVTVAWPTNIGSWSLHGTRVLTPAEWSPVAGPRVISNGQWQIRVPTTNENARFFRLQLP